MSSNLSIYNLSVINLSTITDFPSLCVKYISISLSCNPDFIDPLENSLHSSTHILRVLLLVSSKNFRKALVIVIPVISFKGTTHAYLLKISITYNKKRILLLNVLLNCILARSTPQILSIKDECNFRFQNFVIIGLCNSSANCWLEIVLFSVTDSSCVTKVYDHARVTVSPEYFFIKK